MISLPYWTICISCLLWPAQNLPIHIEQDPKSLDNMGYVAASDYSEWRRCLGFKCEVWDEMRRKLGLVECLTKKDTDCKDKDCTQTVEGDIFLTPQQITLLYKDMQKSTREKRKLQVSNKISQLWQLPIKYIFDETYRNNYTARYYVHRAIQHWQTQTCITFQEIEDVKSVQGSYVIFTSGDYCGSYIGQFPVVPQPVQLSASCQHVASIAHEIGHLIGFWHEHQRSDRDKYVTINGHHTQTETQRVSFLELKGETSNFLPYDYGSLMHYWAWAFTKSGQQTISPTDRLYTQTMGQKVGLSFLDAKLANMAYCPDLCTNPLSSPCLHGGYQDPHNCHQCRCPDGLGGTYCGKVAPSIKGDCSDLILLDVGESRVITSPGYPDNLPYHDNVQCNWLVKTSSPNQRIVVKLDGSRFGVYCNKKVPVCFHWLEVKYHRDQSLTGPRICCSGNPVISLRSEGQQVTLTLRANYPSPASERSGFKVTVSCEQDCGQAAGEVSSSEDTINCDNNRDIASTEDVHSPRALSDTYPLCTRMDLAIAFDETWSSSVHFTNVIDFLKLVVQRFVIGPDHVQIGFVHIGSSAYIKFALTDLPTLSDVLTAVSKLPRKTGKTNMAAAFKILKSEFFTKPRGCRPGVSNVCLLFVNSDSNSKEQAETVRAALDLKEVVQIWAVGTGWASVKELEEICGDETRVFYQNSVRGLIEKNISEIMYRGMCEVLVSEDSTSTNSNHDNTQPQSQNLANRVGEISGDWSCDFETSNGEATLCEMVQFDLASWTVQDDRTAGSVVTAQSGHVYMYLRAGYRGQGASRILLPSQKVHGELCLSFYALLSGHRSNRLEVVVQDTSLQYYSVWQLEADLGVKWYRIEVDVSVTGSEQVGFLGSASGQSGGVGVDSVTVTPDSCYRNRLP